MDRKTSLGTSAGPGGTKNKNFNASASTNGRLATKSAAQRPKSPTNVNTSNNTNSNAAIIRKPSVIQEPSSAGRISSVASGNGNDNASEKINNSNPRSPVTWPGSTAGGGVVSNVFRNAAINTINNSSATISRPLPRSTITSSPFQHALAKSVATIQNKSQNSANFRASVEKAVREHKIFTIVGTYPAVRNALKKRGWIEKNFNSHLAMKTLLNQGKSDSDSSPSLRGSEEESDQAWLLRVLKDYPPDFIWVIRRDNIEWRLLHKDQIINRFPKAFFTTKVGIVACLQNIHWYSEPGVAEILFPRCYRLCLDEERMAFIEDFRLTACFSLLKLFVATYEKDGETAFVDLNSRMSNLHLEFAIRQVNNYIRIRRHEDIDWLAPSALNSAHWDTFLSAYYEVAQGKAKFHFRDQLSQLRAKVEQVRRINQRAAIYWPQYNIDGHNSLWICKPGARSRGKGIVIMSQLEKIMELLSGSGMRESNWVAQKYIERPMLIYKTKFDIRQWFIISHWAPLTIWFYKESYIRFCTKIFNLSDFHESVHLCNNAVQCKYTNSELRDSALPDENMWDCYTFQAYLNTIGKMDAWDKIIYPGMKHAIVGVLLASQESSDNRKNCFELYGADFMLSEDLKPWLIEINSCPCMASTTSVTARLCANCLEDTIKVVLDRRDNKDASTGHFEMVYKQNMAALNSNFYGAQDLFLAGKKMSRDIDWPGIMTKYNNSRGSMSGNAQLGQLSSTRSLNPSTYFEGMSFVDLVERLRLREDENQKTLNMSGPGSSLDQALQRYRQELQSQPEENPVVVVTGNITSISPVNTKANANSKSNSPSPDDNTNNGERSNSMFDTNGILSVKKLPVPADPVVLYNGMPAIANSNNTNVQQGGIKPAPITYEMYPLYNQISNRPQNFATFGNRAAQNKSVYANGFNPVITNLNAKSGIMSYPTVPLTLLSGHPTPVAATMADLFRISQSTEKQASPAFYQPSIIYSNLTRTGQQQQQGKHVPLMVINPIKTQSARSRSNNARTSQSTNQNQNQASPQSSGGTGNNQKYVPVQTLRPPQGQTQQNPQLRGTPSQRSPQE